MKDNIILKYGFILFIITAISTFLVAQAYTITKPIIDEQNIMKNNEARMTILPDAKDFTLKEMELPEGVLEVYEAKDASGAVIGYTIKTSTSGYGGPIEVTTGITTDGTVNAIALGSMSETAGLGANAAKPEFYNQYAGKPATPYSVIKNGTPKDNEIVAISGSTITSNGVTQGVNLAVDLYNNTLK